MGWALKEVTEEGRSDLLPLCYTPSLFSLGLIISVPKPLHHQDGNPLVHTAYLSLALSNTRTPPPHWLPALHQLTTAGQLLPQPSSTTLASRFLPNQHLRGAQVHPSPDPGICLMATLHVCSVFSSGVLKRSLPRMSPQDGKLLEGQPGLTWCRGPHDCCGQAGTCAGGRAREH